MKDETKKRISLYFNLDDKDDRLIWEELEKRKKSQYIKRLILNDINRMASNNNFTPIPQAVLKVEEDKNIIQTDEDEELDDFPDELG